MRRTRNPVYGYTVPWVRIPPFPPEFQQEPRKVDGLRGFLFCELELLLGIHVDLLTPADLPPKFRAKVLAQARPV